ncbi:hypothetical protein QDA00_gp45 [Microbacterium phage Matzah]|uniref:Uncharacterized protein n=2 Tax=Mementomorivirus TaxID=2733194 RepID=A0A6B9LCA6_9CAUD|nr:hypothetical protein HOT41_gp45 [Microbacterium phage MementoMori]YP_010750975.1 hypothetical protein QDA00_gp45 [Microbacterium phage Matzah]AWY05318.1 hypothetical protein SEA_MEMENTOMORI_64 [Microbacterium phage MementoMori]QHB37058.1 hypothetical protein SEA_MATZAH_65 [Microbacterium phage Matzah]
MMDPWLIVALCAVCVLAGCGLGAFTAFSDEERKRPALLARAWEHGHDAGLDDWRRTTETMERGLIPAPYTPNPYREREPRG